MDSSMGTFKGLAQALPADQDAPSLLDLTRALAGLQKEVLSLKQENLELHTDLQRYKPQDTPWGGVKLKQRSPVLQAPLFDLSNHVPRPDSGPTTSTTQPMQETLRKLFAKHLFVQASDNELLNLCQGNKDLLSFITSFNRLVAETECPEEKKISLFYRGLRDDRKDVLAQIVDPPMECSEFIDLVVRLDHRLSKRKGEKFWGDTHLVVLKTEKN
ncbi:hypothetical protein NDU88_004996 [Pleurodeles waltl]|uniref:Retrotransposon gag domain-containing protein n=1 Tax=Pleurodeles waltl TaxID=8319 RepID=A0AAV7UHB3_PLEWA|nr:hypothetical protein NDU88_004996 [Pleurodeles waltl]